MKPVLRQLRLSGAAGAVVRTAMFQQREHLVVPVIALVEGVIFPFNAETPEFVSAEVLAKAPDGWNGRPVVGNHPMSGNEAVSANDPRVLEDQSFGILFGTTGADGKLQTEAWLDPAKAPRVGDDAVRVLARARGEATEASPIEVSVGAFIVLEKSEGEFKGQKYGAIWREIVPDHLAMLPEGVPGACSPEMGCGAPRSARLHVLTVDGIRIEEAEMNKCARCGKDVQAGAACPCPVTAAQEPVAVVVAEAVTPPSADASPVQEPKRSWRDRLRSLFAVRTAAAEITAGTTDVELRDAIDRALRAIEPGYMWTDAVDPDESSVVYAVAPEDMLVLFRRSFTVGGDGSVTLGDDREEVHAVTRFEPVAAAASGEAPAQTTQPVAVATASCGCGHPAAATADGIGDNAMKTKKERALALIADARTAYNADDSAYLEGLSEERLSTIEAFVSTQAIQAAPVADAVVAPVVAPVAQPQAEPVAAKAQTEEEYLAAAPQSIRDLVARQKAQEVARRTALVASLKGATSGAYTEVELQALPLDTLERLATLAKVAAPDPASIDYIAARALPRESSEGVVPAPLDMVARVRAARGVTAAQ